MRGEYNFGNGAPASTVELPPRARRIPYWATAEMVDTGTTSACAENTGNPAGKKTLSRNYLRVRGEYNAMRFKNDTIVELPPRARRIRSWITDPDDPEGTTSACAENTCKFQGAGVGAGNYLRVRGEYASVAPSQSPPWELPPRARRIPVSSREPGSVRGTTSACAENTRR